VKIAPAPANPLKNYDFNLIKIPVVLIIEVGQHFPKLIFEFGIDSLYSIVEHRPLHFRAISKVPCENNEILYDYDDMDGAAKKLNTSSMLEVMKSPCALLFILDNANNTFQRKLLLWHWRY